MPESILLVGKHSVVEPLGMMFLAASLKKAGHKADIHLIREDDTDFINRCWDGEYSHIGFSTYTGFHKIMFRKAKVLREHFKTIIGGPHATYFAKECEQYADYVVVGEGLVATKHILDKKEKPGVVFVSSLLQADKLPAPEREALYKEHPEFRENKIKNVMTSFGCPFNCHYCFNNSYRKLYPLYAPVRQKPVWQIVEECRDLLQYPLDMIYFQDDCFGFSMDWLEDFAQHYRAEVGMPFHCQIRPEMATPDRMKLFKEAGCHGITMAIETVNEKIRHELLNRHMSQECIKSAGVLIKHYGFKLRTEQMLGLPETTMEDELELLRLNCAMKPDIAWTSIFAPYLGTTLGDYCKQIGLYGGDNNDLSDSFFEDSRLNFDAQRKRQTNMLQRVFATCAKFPDGDALARRFITGKDLTWDAWFNTVRRHLFDHSLYKVEASNG